MDSCCVKMTLLVFIALFAMTVKVYHAERIINETEQCGCKPHITIVPPVCGRSAQVDGLQVAVDNNHKSVSSELLNIKEQLEKLQSAVTSIVGVPKECGWQLVFKGVAGTGFNMYDLWTDSIWDSGSDNSGNYRNNILYNSWKSGQLNIKQVKLSLYDQTGVKVELVFNGVDSDISSWFAKERLVSSPWSDLTTTTNTNYFSIFGHDISSGSARRRFFINKIYNGCPLDYGWMVVLDSDGVCQWERSFRSYPVLLYSTQGNINWNVDTSNAGALAMADYLTIHINTE
ncbi:uncharacterized protein [Asterias amurensis]|uniref:uncharacterized protein n=1 Tax=Asterias amurensis TaxID=7602 RepID=UPI003AB24F25